MNKQLPPWHQNQWQTAERWSRTGRWPQAIMLCGAPNAGKRQFAASLVATLLCQCPGDDGHACNKCRSCTLRRAGSHPDLTQIASADGKKRIGIDDVRDFIARVTLTTSIAERKVALIDPAQLMTVAAANSLLKTLEEPPGETVIVLVAEQISRIPKTILSRCQRLAFPAPDPLTALRWREEQGDDTLHGTEHTHDLLPGLVALANNSVSPVKIANEWQGAGLEYVTDWLLRLCCDLVKLKVITQPGIAYTAAVTESMQDLANQLDLFRLFELIDEIHLQRRQYLVHGGLNEQLGLESLAIQCAQACTQRAHV